MEPEREEVRPPPIDMLRDEADEADCEEEGDSGEDDDEEEEEEEEVEGEGGATLSSGVGANEVGAAATAAMDNLRLLVP